MADQDSLEFDSDQPVLSPVGTFPDNSLFFTETQAHDSDETIAPSEAFSEVEDSDVFVTDVTIPDSQPVLDSSPDDSQSTIIKKARKNTKAKPQDIIIRKLQDDIVNKDLDLIKQQAQLDERRSTVRMLQERHKQIKRKYERLTSRESEQKCKRQKVLERLTELKKEVGNKTNQLKICKHKFQIQKAKGNKYFQLYVNKRREAKRLKQRMLSDEIKLANVQSKEEQSEDVEESEKMKLQVKDQQCSIDYLQSLLEDSGDIQLFDSTSKKYSPETVKCVMNLTDLKVPSEKVGKVIREVASLCGKTPNAIPSASTVYRIVDAKLAVAQEQLTDVLGEEKDTTLYTDETRKYGRTVETYVLTDQRQTSYILGLREMSNKSGQTTLDTFQEILNDINDQCHLKEKEKDMHEGYRLLSNIRDTMSDRASTEKTFNRLLEDFRESILPQVVDGWDKLNDHEKSMCSKMNNFFCGLHLLVGMADSCEATLKKFEKSFLDDTAIGSAKYPELKRYHKMESGSLRLIRTCCKAFAVGEDEKNGVSLQWKTYLYHELNEKNRILRFKHNRFNLVFALGHAIFYHRTDITNFLDTVHGTTNDLLKAVSHDIKENLYLAGARALGLISKFVTGPLWKLLEMKDHILDMNSHYKTLVDFLQKGSDDTEVITAFMRGDHTPFDTIVDKDDKVTVCLTEEIPELDRILCPLLQTLFKTINQLLVRMITDHLPGGKFWNPAATTVEESRSVLRHNKLPEFVFGQLDQLLRYRPNSTVLTNEAFLMYSHNRTREWLDSLDEKTRNKLLSDSRKEGLKLRKQFKARLCEIEQKRLEQQKQRQIDLEKKEKKRMQTAENLTNSMCFYGLWQSEEQVREGIVRLPANEQRKAIESQLKFRKQVLHQKYQDPKIFSFSRKNEAGKYVKHTLENLTKNLVTLIKETMSATTTELQQEGIPLFVGKHVDHDFDTGTHRGFVISVVPGFPKWYNVKYQNDDAVYAYNLCEDYDKGDIRIVVNPEDEGPSDEE